MITNPRVFEDGHLPRELPHRNAQLQQLARALAPATAGRPTEDLLISGPSGVGKTVLCQWGLRHLDEAADVEHTYVRCLGRTGGDVLRSILRDHPGVDPAEVRDNTPTEDLRERLLATDQSFVAVLDEADDLPDTDTLDLLTGNAALSLIVICHDAERWRSRLDAQRARSFDGDRHIALDSYHVDELAGILQRRARHGLPPGAVDRGHLERIADEVAGVAREGIQALRAAAELADERGHARIRDEDIDDCFERARHRIRELNLRSLPFHHQVLYTLVYEAGEIAAPDLHDRYDNLAEDLYEGHPATPICRRTRRNKLQKLEDYDLIEVEGDGRARIYRPTDPEIVAAIDADLHPPARRSHE